VSDLIVTQPPQDDLKVTVQPLPTAAPEVDDMVVTIPPQDMVIQLPQDDMQIKMRVDDLVVAVPPVGLQVTMTDMGPIGMPGPAGDAPIIDTTADVAIGGHRVVRSVPDGKVDLASSDVASHGDQILGITQNAAVAGDTLHVQTAGLMVEGSWNWTVGPVYCGLNGLLTQVVPDAGFMCRVAKALSTTTILINVEEAVLLA